ncbi:MAG: hypothetical protein OWR52_08705 [Acidibacillus sp.]|uniref:Uncharacterized protein n=1 Tax=Sulfoacidibacillus ferrooxidans TaxID=2005001 RepID=A0A9X1V9W4_9BACL|nr:hypothetical protein [Sulfoacidibacillus ferrooxidans]MCI0183900.1 hypothetical protein [Sulfoacidibacillus ferrooxidans]MCY0893572.1 hypothetical protein [Acidibacillus sp.]
MTQLWGISLILCGVGLWLHNDSALIIGSGLFTVSWFTIIDEVQGSPVITWSKRCLYKWSIQWKLRKLIHEHEEIVGLCRRFAQKYPRYLRVPYQFGESNEVRLAKLPIVYAHHVSIKEFPAPWNDLAVVAKRQIGFSVDVLLLVLIANREVCKFYRSRIEIEVLQKKQLETAEDFASACLRFSIWERECERENGAPTFLYRELFATLLEEFWSVQQMRQFVKATRLTPVLTIVNTGIAIAQEAVVKNRRAIILESRLFNKERSDGVHEDVDLEVENELLTVDSLNQLATENMVACIHLIQEVFIQDKASLATRCEAEHDGYFVTHTGNQRILFQIGVADEDGSVALSILDHVYVRMALEQTVRAMVLSLGKVDARFLQYADQLGILVLPSAELDRLLAAYTERMWHIVDWSLRTSMRAQKQVDDDVEILNEIPSEGLELGLST